MLCNQNSSCIQDVPQETAQESMLEHPITHTQMLTLLEPLQSCLQRMESRLDALSKTGMESRHGAQGDMHAGSEEVCTSRVPSETSPRDQQARSKDGLSPIVEDRTDDPHAVVFIDSDKHRIPLDLVPKASWTAPALDVGIEVIEDPAVNLATPADFVQNYRIHQQISGQTVGTVAAPLLGKFIFFLEKTLQAWGSIKEPQRNSRISKFVMSGGFETTCQLVTVLNVVLLAFAASWDIQNIGMGKPLILDVLEWSCLTFFTLELVLRLIVHRLYFFLNNDMAWNIFDFGLVSFTLVEVVLQKIRSGRSGSNLAFMRLVRLFKLARILRFLRLFRFFSALSVLVDSLRDSILPLFWCLALLSCIIYLTALAFIQGFVAYLGNNDVDPSVRRDIDTYFGSMMATSWTLYKSVTAVEDWTGYHELVKKAGYMYGILFLFFISFSQFALFNLMTGLIVEKAMASAEPTKSEQIVAHRKKLAEKKASFKEICQAMDSDGSGKISWSEFKKWMQNPVMYTYLSSMELDVLDVELFFAIMAAQSRKKSSKAAKETEVTFDHFVEGCMHMQGHASSIDVQRQLFETHKLHEKVDKFEHQVQRLEHVVNRGFQSLNVVKRTVL